MLRLSPNLQLINSFFQVAGLRAEFEEMEGVMSTLQENFSSAVIQLTSDLEAKMDGIQGGAGGGHRFDQLQTSVEELQTEVGAANGGVAGVEMVDGLWDRVRELTKQIEQLSE